MANLLWRVGPGLGFKPTEPLALHTDQTGFALGVDLFGGHSFRCFGPENLTKKKLSSAFFSSLRVDGRKTCPTQPIFFWEAAEKRSFAGSFTCDSVSPISSCKPKKVWKFIGAHLKRR